MTHQKYKIQHTKYKIQNTPKMPLLATKSTLVQDIRQPSYYFTSFVRRRQTFWAITHPPVAIFTIFTSAAK